MRNDERDFKVEGPLLRKIDICENIRNWYKAQKVLRDVESAIDVNNNNDNNNNNNNSDNKTKCQMTVESIHNYNDESLMKSGPNKSNAHKLRQLLRHERLDKLYKSGKLRRCTLSYYLHKMTTLRKQMIDRLSGRISNITVPLKVPTRLAKFPVGTTCAADRVMRLLLLLLLLLFILLYVGICI